MTTIEERLSRLEGGYEHLSTKEDLARLETRLIKWIIGIMIGSIAIASTFALLIERLTGG